MLRKLWLGLVVFFGAAAWAWADAVPAKIDSGDTTWVLVSAALVMLMTPALGFFYAGLVRRINLVSTLTQCLAIFAVLSVQLLSTTIKSN